VINLGLPSFATAIDERGGSALHVDWSPPAGGDPGLLDALDRLLWAGALGSERQRRIEAANNVGVQRLIDAQAMLVDVRPAREVIPGMTEDTILHAGPPVAWEAMCGPMRGAVAGALIYEGRAKDYEAACELAASGRIHFDPCHHHRTVGPMAGVVSPSMWVWVLENPVHGNRAYCTLNEGLGKVLRFGAYDDEVIAKLRWMERFLAPALAGAVRLSGGINVKALISQALAMGDELHNRNVAGTSLFIRAIYPHLLGSELTKLEVRQVLDFIDANNHFFLNLSMPAGKLAADTILGLSDSTLMCAMARNGVELGIRVAGLGDRWFTGPAGEPKGLYFAGFGPADANRDLGDSTICETAGFGGFAMACAPAIVKFTGGEASRAAAITREMYEITVARHRDYQIPVFDFAGTPVGVDIRRVVERSATPYINTGIAHRQAGIGQVGAGLLRAPFVAFADALRAFAAHP
jgi:hypothetical protein